MSTVNSAQPGLQSGMLPDIVSCFDGVLQGVGFGGVLFGFHQQFYGLERLWADAEQIDLKDILAAE